jgi:argininosuccinate lyase
MSGSKSEPPPFLVIILPFSSKFVNILHIFFTAVHGPPAVSMQGCHTDRGQHQAVDFPEKAGTIKPQPAAIRDIRKGDGCMKLWGGRMSKNTNPMAQQLTTSFPFDQRLYQEDIEVRQAWLQALEEAEIISSMEAHALIDGLKQIKDEFDEGTFEPLPTDEDIHTAVERRLKELVGEPAGKLQTGYSRNDLSATDLRMWTSRSCRHLDKLLLDLEMAMLSSAQEGQEWIMPGYTQMQQSQPITWAHWMLSYFWPLDRDRQRLAQVHQSASEMPLGAASLAGTTFPIDRAALAKQLGFDRISPNSLDAVSNRDFALEFLFACSLAGIHLSQLAETLMIFNTAEFGFIDIDETFTTGSSLNPQKKNPDALALARAKSGRLIGHLTSLLSTMKALPSAFDKDLQEDKEPLFDAFDTLCLLLPVMAGLLRNLQPQPEIMRGQLNPNTLATDLAEYLVLKGVPFRQAHELIGWAVRLAEKRDIPLTALSMQDLKAVSQDFEDDVVDMFDYLVSVNRHISEGGASLKSLGAQIKAAKSAIKTRYYG